MKSTAYFTRNGTKLEKRGDSILAISLDGCKNYFPLEQIDQICLQGTVHVSWPLFNEISKRGIIVHYSTYGGKPKGTFLPPQRTNGKVRLLQYKSYFSEKRIGIAKGIISTASKNKLTILKRYYRKTFDANIAKSVTSITSCIKQLKECESVESLRGYEGMITRLYYSCFETIFKQFCFENRNRQPPQDPINALLSFGYMVLYDEMSGLIFNTGLDVSLGFLHEMGTAKPSLSLDLSEVFKQPLIDSIILELVNNNRLQDKHFLRKEKFCFLNNLGKNLFLRKLSLKLNGTFYDKVLGEHVSYKTVMQRDVYKLIKVLSGEKELFEGFRIY